MGCATKAVWHLPDQRCLSTTAGLHWVKPGTWFILGTVAFCTLQILQNKNRAQHFPSSAVSLALVSEWAMVWEPRGGCISDSPQPTQALGTVCGRPEASGHQWAALGGSKEGQHSHHTLGSQSSGVRQKETRVCGHPPPSPPSLGVRGLTDVSSDMTNADW